MESQQQQEQQEQIMNCMLEAYLLMPLNKI